MVVYDGGVTVTRRRGSGGLAEGTVVIIDLDRFGEVVEERGWSEYSPNPATGLLTRLVEELVSKWSGYLVYGLDEERGTEEAVIEFPLVEPEELREDLERIRRELNRVGVGVTIVAVKGHVGLLSRSADRRAAYSATPARRMAAKLLRQAKRRGGNVVIVA